ncbi:unnamed protein product [Linum tenue]|uniref:Acid phosphatase n=2 Tax=Linum tenue TaxID=586396 RepID=A0AAV0JPW0_9ROSI|nr:unnamed protein product [Linum tenue]
MSAYAHQMDREFSAGSLSSGEDSEEMRSRYVMESGFYMTSFAATMFIALLVTVGVLMISLLILLTVMLQSCENRSKGVIEQMTLQQRPTTSFLKSYHNCRSFAELNNLKSPDLLPPMCWDRIVDHHNQPVAGGEYERDLTASLWVVEGYFDGVKPSDDNGQDAVVLIDIDNSIIFNSKQFRQQVLLLRVYKKLQASGWSLVLVSRNPEKQRNGTEEQLVSAGYGGWSSLVLRPDDEMEHSTTEYISRQRVLMETRGIRVAAIISSQMDALTKGPSGSGTRVFKLPNPVYYYNDYFQDFRISTELPEETALTQ